MSKIVIKEYDNSARPNNKYENFAVLVPGYLGTPKEGYNPDEIFDANGVAKLTTQTDFEKYIGFKKASGVRCAEYDKDVVIDSEEKYNEYVSSNRVHTWSIITDEAQKVPGKYKIHNEIGWFLVNSTPESGTYDASKQYVLITDLGSDDATVQMGNQIAYELLGLGYEVLFKKIVGELNQLADFTNFWSPMVDKSEYDFRYIISGVIDVANCEGVNEAMAKLACYNNNKNPYDTDQGRGDCVALCEIAGYSATAIQKENIKGITNYVNTQDKADKFSMFIGPSVEYSFERKAEYDAASGYDKNRKFPGCFHYLACAAKASRNYREWYAVGGYNRGISDFEIVGTGAKFGDAAVYMLQPRSVYTIPGTEIKVNKAVNLIVKIGDQYLLWGNRTANKISDELVASDFLNIRQLCCTLKKQIYIACRQVAFDPNSEILWNNFKAKLTPLLESMKNDQGIEDYMFIKVKDSRKGLLNAQVRIVPIEAVEDFEIGVYLEDSLEGITISEE